MAMSSKIISSAVVFVLLAIVVLGAVLWEKERIYTRPSDPLRTIFMAQIEYAREHPDKGFASNLVDLGIDSILARGTKSGYEFILWTAGPDSQGRALHFFVASRPESYRQGERSFFIDESGVGRFTTENRAATAKDPPIQ